ncbi:hypothetical protein [Amycolatopsis sp. NBC_00438]|uniref:hypothetical protein n=1 Tax=Amycolatopsis sp. NBC_00438 TaxID=2903558 RepID=UPI002E1E507D
MDPEADPPALFTLPPQRKPLAAFRNRLTHHRPAETPPGPPPTWRRAHAGDRGRTTAGTVHLVTGDWLPACGTGLNSWDYRGLRPTDDEVTCGRCAARDARNRPPKGQLTLF